MMKHIFSNRKVISLTLLAIILASSALIFIPNASASTANMRKVADVLDGTTYDIFVEGDTAYIACGWGGLKIYDISIPSEARLIGELDDIGDIISVIVRDQYAYLAAGEAGILIVDISDLDDLSVEGSLFDGGSGEYAVELELLGNYALMADYEDGLEILDISDPFNPGAVSDYDFNDFSITDIAINAPYVYVTNFYYNRLEILDISNIYNPIYIGAYSDGVGMPLDVCVADDLVYLADFNGGLEILNVSNPSHITEIGNYSAAEVASVYVNGTNAFISTNTSLEILNVSDPTNPIPMGSVPVTADEMHFVNPILYLADQWHEGVSIVNVTNTSEPVIIGSFDNEMYVGSLDIRDSTLCVTGTDGISLVDVEDPENPIPFANNSEISDTLTAQLTSSFIYTADSNEFLVINSSTMAIVGSYNHSSGIRGIEIEGEYAYLGCYNGTHSSYAVIDISEPTDPDLIKEYIYLSSSWELVAGTVRDDLLLLLLLNTEAHGETYLIPIDIRIPGLPTEITQFPVGRNCFGICAQGDYAYVTSYQQGVKIIDISMPGAPEIIAEYSYPLSINPFDFYTDIRIQNDFLYVAIFPGILILDVYNKDSPEYVQYFEDETLPYTLEVSGNYIYYTTGSDGVEIIEAIIEPGKRSRIPGYSIYFTVTLSVAVSFLLVKKISQDKRY